MQFLNSQTLFVAAKGQGISRDDVLLHVDNTDSTLLHLAVESGVAKVGREYFLCCCLSSVTLIFYRFKSGWDEHVGEVRRFFFLVLFFSFLSNIYLYLKILSALIDLSI